MSSRKRAKLSQSNLEESTSVAAGSAAADDDDEDEDGEDADLDDVEQEEEEESSDDSDEEERELGGEGQPPRNNLDKANDDLARRIHRKSDDDDAIDEEEVEIVEVVEEEEETDQGEVDEEEEEIEEVLIEEEEVDDEDGEEESEAERQEEERCNVGEGSDMESVEGEAESVDNDAGVLKQAHVSNDDAEENARGDIDDADEENEGSFTNQKHNLDEDDTENEEDDIDSEEDEDDEGSTGRQPSNEDNDDEDNRRKQLAVLMCMSSLQSLMAMELCRDTTYPFDEIMREDSNMLSVAFLKLTVLAITSLMREDGWQCWEFQRPGQQWARIDRGVGSIDSATRDSIWRRKYSMSYACFLYLVEELRPFIQSEAHMHVRVPLEIERAVAMVLYRLAHGFSAHEVAEKYKVGASTVAKYTLIVASALSEAGKLYGRYIAIPTGNRIERIISQFQQIINVSQVCGAIDCTHIKLSIKPDKWGSSSAYQSPPKLQSILLQAVCDANKLFWDVCCMAPGSAHEAAHFVTSNLYQKVNDGLSLQEPVITLENQEVTPLMVGDHAYPLRPFVITPFDTDDALRKAFDEQIQKGLVCIKGAFAILKTRWKVLRCINFQLMHAPRIVVACSVLHNICQLWGEPEPPHEQLEQCVNEHSQGVAVASEIDEASRTAGEATREAIFRDWVKRSLDSPYVRLDQENLITGKT